MDTVRTIVRIAKWAARPNRIVWAAVLVAISGCAPSLPASTTPAPGTYYQGTPHRYKLTRRAYRVHVPQGYTNDRTWPLVVVLHGAFSNARQIQKWSAFDRLADQEGLVVAYPEAIGLFGFLQHWNAGHCCGPAATDNVDDVGFVGYVIDDVSAKLAVDSRRVYIVGHSNGGMLAYRFAAERSHKVAAIAVVAGTLSSSVAGRRPQWTPPMPAAPVPLIAVHGRKDEHIPFEGGPSERSDPDRSYMSVLDSVGSWARHCGCEHAPKAIEDLRTGQRVMVWLDSRARECVALHTLDDWAHDWPGTFFTNPLGEDHPLRGFEASEIIWSFFKNHAGSIR